MSHSQRSELSDEAVPAPVPRLGAHDAVTKLNANLGLGLELSGIPSGGEVGAAYVRWPDGREGVLTRGPRDVRTAERTTSILPLARTRGIPCPRYDLVRQLADGSVIVQERLPGSPPRLITERLIKSMIAINDGFAGLLVDRPDVPSLDLFLDRSGPGFCLHEPLARHDRRTRRLLAWVRGVGEHPASVMTGDDLVHPDYHPGNVLVDERGNVTGVIDWDAAGRGDRRFGLVTLAFDLGWRARLAGQDNVETRSALRLVNEHLDAMDRVTLRAYWAHMSLRQVDWSIRHHSAEVVDHYLDFASSRFDVLG